MEGVGRDRYGRLLAVVTAGEMLYKPTATAHAADLAPPGMHGRYQSLYGAASIGGTILAPPLAGWLLQHGSRVTWSAGALLGLVAAVAVARYWKLTNSTEGLSASTRAADISGRSQS